jgi:hypothetical protein
MTKHDYTSTTVGGAASLARSFFRGEVGDRGDYDPDPPEEFPDCGHDECEDHWREACYGEDDLVDTGCVRAYRWDVDLYVNDRWIEHPEHPDGFVGTFREAQVFRRGVSGNARVDLSEDG